MTLLFLVHSFEERLYIQRKNKYEVPIVNNKILFKKGLLEKKVEQFIIFFCDGPLV
jgi:hypothetical protein